MKHTFLTAQPLVPGRRYRLDRHEAVLASHLKARRIRVGEKLQFVNNSGSVFDAQCVSIGDWEFEITGSRVVPRALPLIELYLAPPKGDALTECLQQATECGVSSISFVSSEFCQVSHKDAPPFERAERVVASSQAQCVQPFEVRVSPLWHSVQEVSLQDQAHWCDERLSEHPKIVVGSQTTPSESLQLWIGWTRKLTPFENVFI